MIRAAALIAAALALAACGEKPQVAATGNHDTPAYQGTGTAFQVPGWKAGDRAAWDQQLKTRTQGQNDYVKVN